MLIDLARFAQTNPMNRVAAVAATMGRMKDPKLLAAFAALALMAAGWAGMSGQAPQAAAQSGSAPQLVILDTDIGDDIDDAFALALVLQSPELRLLGIETAFGDTELRARLVDRYLKAVGRGDIPVLAGIGTKGGQFTQAPYARQWTSTGSARRHGDAVPFLLDQIRAHPAQITLIAIGPLFNIQAAIKRDPATFRRLKRVVIMGGSVYRGYDGEHGAEHSPRPSGTFSAIRRGPGRCSLPACRSSSSRSIRHRSTWRIRPWGRSSPTARR